MKEQRVVSGVLRSAGRLFHVRSIANACGIDFRRTSKKSQNYRPPPIRLLLTSIFSSSYIYYVVDSFRTGEQNQKVLRKIDYQLVLVVRCRAVADADSEVEHVATAASAPHSDKSYLMRTAQFVAINFPLCLGRFTSKPRMLYIKDFISQHSAAKTQKHKRKRQTLF